MDTPQKIAVIGGGSWATALVKILCNNCTQVHWWMRSDESIAHIQQYGHNPKYLQSVAFDTSKLVLSSNLQHTLNAVDWIVIATPAAFLEEAFAGIDESYFTDKIVFSAVKGMIPSYNAIPARFIHKSFGVPYDSIGIISGPCHAEEVAMESSLATEPIDVFTGRTIRTIILENFRGCLVLTTNIHTHTMMSTTYILTFSTNHGCWS
jgi:glycerol-3-phosphate dehydrogenase (NAD(P)+)